MSEALPHPPDARPAGACYPFPSGRWLALFALVVVLLYAAGVSTHWRFQRDSTLYMGLARSLAESGAYSFNGEPQRLALPGFPAILSLVYMTVGESFLAMNVVMALFGLACVALGWLVFRAQPLSRSQALACLVLLAFSRTLFYYSSQVITDVPFTFFVLLGLYCGARTLRGPSSRKGAWGLAAACATLAACSVRPLGLALLIALVAATWLHGGALRQWRANLARTCLLAAPTAAAAGLWAHRGAALGTATGTSYFHWFLGAPGPAGAALHVIGRAPMVIGSLSDTVLGSDLGLPLSIALALPIGVGFVDALRRGERLLCAFGVAYVGAVCLANPGRRFLLPVLPAFLVWLVLGAGAMATYLAERRRRLSPASLARAGWVLIALLALTNMAHASKTIYEAHSADFYATIEDGRLPDYFRLAQWLHDHARSDDCVLANESSFIHYFSRVRTRRIAMEAMEFDVRAQAQRMKLAGVTYLVVDPDQGAASERTGQLLRAYPGAFSKVQTFGKLDLYHVRLDKL
jgi:hypothetical protein